VACDSLRENQICYIGSPQRTAKLIDEYLLKYETVTMQYFNKLMALVFLLGFYFSRTAVAQDSTVVPSKFWVISRMMKRQSKVYIGTSIFFLFSTTMESRMEPFLASIPWMVIHLFWL